MRSRSVQELLGLRFDRLSPCAHFALACALLALWLLGRRYAGITHDATLYVAQGLRRLHPGLLDGDLFFAHGSQDAYTFFPFLYAQLIGLFGAGAAAMMVTIAGQLAFFAAAALLVARVTTGMTRWWSLALLAAISGYYGGVGTMRIAEPFATARTLAEPLVLAALYGTLAGRPALSLLALAGATAIHPLVAAPGIAVIFFWHAAERPRLLWAAPLLVVLAAALAIAWPGVALRFDAAWLAAVRDRSPQLFLSLWQLPDWARVLWGLCVLRLALPYLQPTARRLALSIAVVGTVGILASGLAVDVLGSAGAAGLQMWRAHWLVQLLAIVLLPVAATGLWRRGYAGRAAAACLAASFCFGRSELPAAALLAAVSAVLDEAERRQPGWMREGALRPVLLMSVCAAGAGLLFEVQSRLPAVYGATRPAEWMDYVHAAGSIGGLLPLALLLWLAACSRFRVAGLVLAAGALALAVAAWDARAPWPRFIEQASAAPNLFREKIPPGSQVFWTARHSPVWLVLGRPTWFSADQGAGIVFSRTTAIEHAERNRASRKLFEANENCAFAGPAPCVIEAENARALCRRPDGPSFLVLNSPIAGQASIDWPLPAGVLPGVRQLHLISCKGFAGNAKGRR